MVNPAVEDWGAWLRKRREERREAPDGASDETIAKRFGGATGADSGALNDKNDPGMKRRRSHAKRYYEEVRRRDARTEVSEVSKNSGIEEKIVRTVYRHVFVENHDLSGGRRRFDPDYDMAQSWQRLRTGKGILKHDRTLVMHEYVEAGLMRGGMSYEDAQEEACRRGYNYQKELDEWLSGGT